ncbi:MAG TPA: DUF1732 domain-containing protein, partial [Candidatus Binatia bacterium]
MKSMTGYGEASQNVRGAKVTIQIRSLNHRHLDLQLRVPREYLSFEEEIRKTLRQRISRGRVDLFINRYAAKAQSRRLDVDEALVGQYIVGMTQLKKKYRLAGEIGVSLLSTIPDLFHIRELEVNGAEERRAVLKALGGALKKLERSREREGGHLKADMESQVEHLKRIAGGLEKGAVEIALRFQKGSVREEENGSRADREVVDVANLLFKGDVNEEIVRLKTHVAALGKAIREREPVGKKIDFMLQEVNRELNTISSKVPHLPIVQLVLQGK